MASAMGTTKVNMNRAGIRYESVGIARLLQSVGCGRIPFERLIDGGWVRKLLRDRVK